MRKIAKLLSMLLAVAMLSSLGTITASAAFRDVSAKDEALYEAVQLLNSLGIAKGTSETSYGVNKEVTREQMAAFVYRLMKGGRSLEGGANMTGFTDLLDPTYYGMISWASTNGIIKGRSETEFDPYGDIMLQDAYVMLTRALGYEKDEKLSYPHEYIDIAEQIGLSKNLDPDLQYTDTLTRGNVAIILYNAFYAKMNETYSRLFVPAFEHPNTASSALYIDTPETVCHKIYGIEIVTRRVVATPNYALDITALGTGDQYQAYQPTGGDTVDTELIQLAAIVPDESAALMPEEKLLVEFEDLGLSGNADDYFLNDLTIYLKDDGTIMAASATGAKTADTTVSVQTRGGNDYYRDYLMSCSVDANGNDITMSQIRSNGTKLRTGMITFGSTPGFFWNKPDSVPNYAISIYPSDSVDGRMTFKAGYTWCGDKYVTDGVMSYFTESPKSYAADRVAYMNVQRTNHGNVVRLLGSALVSNRYTLDAYDSNLDGYIDYFWLKPYTFGVIVDRTGENNGTRAQHTGDSANRAVWSATRKLPLIYVGDDAIVEGGKYSDGMYAFAYVNGPANYVKIAPDGDNAGISTFTASVTSFNIENGNSKNSSHWSNGSTINAWNSGNFIVGHVNASQNGLVALDSDRTGGEAFAGSWRGQLQIGDTWEIVQYAGRVMLSKKLAEAVNIGNEYAIIQYVDEPSLQVVWQGGGISMDGTLETDNYVNAYLGGKYQYVKIAKKNDLSDSGRQDDNYFVDKGLVNALSSYTVDGNGYYTFKPFVTGGDKAQASALADKDDATGTYRVTVSNVSLKKIQDRIYSFVPGAGSETLPAELAPNGMKYVSMTNDTKIVLNYVDEDGESNYVVYDINNLPNFDASDESMNFTKAVVELKNRTDSTVTEYLSFMYCEIGGEIVDTTKVTKDHVIILGSIQTVDSDNRVINAYKVVNALTGEVTEMMQTAKSTSKLIDNYDMYELTENGDIKNTTGGRVASLAKGSKDLKRVEAFEAESNLLFLVGQENPYLVDENTAYVLLNRGDDTVTVMDSSMLEISAEDDPDNDYFNEGEEQLTVYVFSEDRDDEDFEFATLVIVAKG